MPSLGCSFCHFDKGQWLGPGTVADSNHGIMVRFRGKKWSMSWQRACLLSKSCRSTALLKNLPRSTLSYKHRIFWVCFKFWKGGTSAKCDQPSFSVWVSFCWADVLVSSRLWSCQQNQLPSAQHEPTARDPCYDCASESREAATSLQMFWVVPTDC